MTISEIKNLDERNYVYQQLSEERIKFERLRAFCNEMEEEELNKEINRWKQNYPARIAYYRKKYRIMKMLENVMKDF
jgi:dsDNA-specific endonuclease/ATPase MutS2